ncbi:MAG: Gfo/Idh/MocA family oxidoreductase, partial [Thermomicrobiales bacterium]
MPTPSDSTSPAKPQPLRVAVLGCGAQGRNHLTAYAALPGIEIAAICDLDPARRAATGETWGVPKSGQFADYRDLLAQAGPLDIVSICTMPISHREMTVAALDAGANVICEKPTALNLAEAQAMHAAA